MTDEHASGPCGPQDRPEVEAAITRWVAAELAAALAAQLAAGRTTDVDEALQILAGTGRLVEVAGVLLVQVVAGAVETAVDLDRAADVLRARELDARQAVHAELTGALS